MHCHYYSVQVFFFFFSLLQCHSLQNIALLSHFAELATKQQVVARRVVNKIEGAALSRITKWRICIASPPADKPNAAFIYYLCSLHHYAAVTASGILQKQGFP